VSGHRQFVTPIVKVADDSLVSKQELVRFTPDHPSRVRSAEIDDAYTQGAKGDAHKVVAIMTISYASH
jgi:hypothetical protein